MGLCPFCVRVFILLINNPLNQLFAILELKNGKKKKNKEPGVFMKEPVKNRGGLWVQIILIVYVCDHEIG